MKVAIVGSGVSGLAAARTLQASGVEAIVFEKLPLPGGRVRTEELAGYVFDSGASSIAPRGFALEKVILSELDQQNLIKVQNPIYAHKGLRVEMGDPSKMKIDRYTYSKGNSELPKLLSETLTIRYNTQVQEIQQSNNRYAVNGEPFDAVIVAIPAPLVEDIINGPFMARSIGYVTYRKCLSVMLGVADSLPDLPYHALIDPEQRHPLTWLSIESQKAPGRAPEGCTALVAQLSPEYSRQKFESEDSTIIGDTIDYINRLYSRAWESVKVSAVHRWRYSQPENVAMFDSVNPPGETLIFAGDGMRGGRVEYAYETGVLAAQRLLESL